MLSATPRFPDEDSTRIECGVRTPARSAASTISVAALSLIEPAKLKPSHFRHSGRPKSPQTGLVGANHVKAPPPPLNTFGDPIEFKQHAPKSRIARNQDVFQTPHLGLLAPTPSCFLHESGARPPG